MPASALSDSSTTTFTNPDTGVTVQLPSAASPSRLRARILALDAQSAWVRGGAGAGEAAVALDVPSRTYRFARYPPLAFFFDVRLFAVLCAFFIAGCAQLSFFFPCLPGFTLALPAGAPAVSAANPGYCVDNSVAGALAAAPTAAALEAAGASKRIAVTMQTYAVMMAGAIAGRWGGLAAAALYVAMVCLGAPFQAASGGKGLAVWDKGGVVGVSGGFFWGFIAAALVMGRAMERGAGRGGSWRSALWLVPHMLGAEAAIYACGLFWYPFGAAIRAGVAASATPVLGCSAARGGEVSASKCLYTIFNVMMVPYLPGECFKMLLVLATVPLCWALLLRFHRWRSGGGDIVSEVEDDGGEAPAAVAEKVGEQEGAAAALQVRAPV